MIKTAFAGELPVKKITNVRTIASAMEQCDIYVGMKLTKFLKRFL